MSAEGKKKRGIAGMSNAQNIDFRYGGSRCDYSEGRRPGAAGHPRWAGSKLVQAYSLGVLLKDKFSMETSPILANRIDAALSRCTVA